MVRRSVPAKPVFARDFMSIENMRGCTENGEMGEMGSCVAIGKSLMQLHTLHPNVTRHLGALFVSR